MEKPVRILAVKLRAIGDTVIWTSALASLREAHPAAEIHALTFGSNEAVLRGNGDIDVLHLVKSRSRLDLALKFLELRRFRFDWMLVFNSYAAVSRWHWLVGAGKKAIYHHGRTSVPFGCVTIPHAGEMEDAIARDGRVLEAMGIRLKRHPTRIAPEPTESFLAERIIRESVEAGGGDPGKPRYLFLPGASHPLRRFPREKLLRLAAEVAAEGTYQPLVLADRPLSLEWDLPRHCRELRLPLIDHLGLREFIACMSCAERAVANDSGPAHLAVALGLRTVFLFGPGSAGEWHPYDKGRHPMIRITVPCRTNGPQDRELFRTCGDARCAHQMCMRDLNVTLGDLLG
jgi:ADP-heptose:LPS heptosyltransferase